MPFWDQLSFPCELTLQTFPEGIRVCRQPINEIAMLYNQVYEWKDVTLNPADNPLSDLFGQLFDIDAEFDLGNASEIGFIIRGFPIRFIAKQRQLCFLEKLMPMTVTENHIHIRLLVDRTSIEIFGNQGQTVLSCCFLPKREDESYKVYANDGRAKIAMMKVRSLHSIWKLT
jgi:fructan beta-fructosidase